MATITSLDTNCLLRWVLRDIPEQSAAVSNLLQAGTHHIADIAISEFVFVLEKSYGYPRDLIVANVARIAAQPTIQCNRELLKSVLPAYEKYPALSFNDCYLATYAKLHDVAPLLTFDRNLANQLQHAELLITS